MIEVNGHWYLKWDPVTAFSSFASSKTPRTNQGNTASRWHKVLAHAGPEAIKRLEEHTDGARVEDPEEAPKTIDCESCSVSKAKHLISRRTGNEEPAMKPFERVAFDLIPMEEACDGDK